MVKLFGELVEVGVKEVTVKVLAVKYYNKYEF